MFERVRWDQKVGGDGTDPEAQTVDTTRDRGWNRKRHFSLGFT